MQKSYRKRPKVNPAGVGRLTSFAHFRNIYPDGNHSSGDGNRNFSAFAQQLELDSAAAIHQKQLDNFYYTCFILLAYAALILYFMLRQICYQERKYYERIHGRLRLINREESAKLKEDRQMRSNIKKQLCMHLIKVGQLQESIARRTTSTVHAIGQRDSPDTRHQECQTDLCFLITESFESEEDRCHRNYFMNSFDTIPPQLSPFPASPTGSPRGLHPPQQIPCSPSPSMRSMREYTISPLVDCDPPLNISMRRSPSPRRLSRQNALEVPRVNFYASGHMRSVSSSGVDLESLGRSLSPTKEEHDNDCITFV